MSGAALDALLGEVRRCRVCAADLPLGPRPVLRASPSARLLIIGQAPGTKVHESGVPWNDPSGERLRDWLAMERGVFYDEARVAIVPMGFCYPGREENGGDKPPRPECAPQWHEKLRERLPHVELTLLVGSYAQKYYLAGRGAKTMTETVGRWREYLPRFMVTPHPSWRTTGWQKNHPWFERELLPELKSRVAAVLAGTISR